MRDDPLALEVRDLSVELGGTPIVTRVRLEIPRGSWVCVIGPNGAGKTTLVHAVAGLLPHTGSVLLSGRPTEDLGRRTRARTVALVPQLPVIPEGITVEQYVLLGRTPHLGLLSAEGRRDHQAVASAIDRLDLGWATARRLQTLSGGELRRVVIARALAQEAPLLLLDEPTTGLDLGQQLRVLELIDELRRGGGLTVVSTMHDLTLAGRFAERFALLSGRPAGRRGFACRGPRIACHRRALRGRRSRDRRRGDRMGGRPGPGVRTVSGRPPKEGPRLGRGRVSSRVLVNTGDGKGKSSAAFGVAMRAAGSGWRVAVVQFVKSGRWKTGEEASARTLGIDWWSIGDGFTWDSKDMEESEAVAREAWRSAAELIRAGAHRLVVLDEIAYPMNWGWISTAEVVETIRSRPDEVSVIVTGRDAPAEIREIADTVTEMVAEKHAFDRGIDAMRGIEF